MKNWLFLIILISLILFVSIPIVLLSLQALGYFTFSNKAQTNILFSKDILLGLAALYGAVIATVNLKREIRNVSFATKITIGSSSL